MGRETTIGSLCKELGLDSAQTTRLQKHTLNFLDRQTCGKVYGLSDDGIQRLVQIFFKQDSGSDHFNQTKPNCYRWAVESHRPVIEKKVAAIMKLQRDNAFERVGRKDTITVNLSPAPRAESSAAASTNADVEDVRRDGGGKRICLASPTCTLQLSPGEEHCEQSSTQNLDGPSVNSVNTNNRSNTGRSDSSEYELSAALYNYRGTWYGFKSLEDKVAALEGMLDVVHRHFETVRLQQYTQILTPAERQRSREIVAFERDVDSVLTAHLKKVGQVLA